MRDRARPTDRVAPVVVTRAMPTARGPAWLALTRPAVISTWFTACERLPGPRYALGFAEDDGEHVKTALPLTWWRRDTELGFSILLQDPGYADSVVEVGVRAADVGCEVRVRHVDPPPDLVEGYRTGWADYLERLAEHLDPPRDAPAGGAGLGPGQAVVRLVQILGVVLLAVAALPLALVRTARGPGRVARAAGSVLGDALWRLGPAFVKVGQLLATRQDVLPAALCGQLQAQLAFGRVCREPSGRVHDVGSVAQVRRARIGGRDVAIKTIPPETVRRLGVDLALLTALTAVVSRALRRCGVPLSQIVAELTESVRRQTDLAAEASALATFGGLQHTLPVALPTVVAEHSDRNRLVMTWLPGQSGGRRFANDRRAAKRLVLTVYEMLFITGVVHCDLHPGNWWELPDGRLAIIDAGFTYELGDTMRHHFAEFFLGMAAGNAHACATHALAVTIAPVDPAGEAAFRRDMAELIDSTTGLTAGDFSLARFAARFFAIQRRHGAFSEGRFIFPFMALLAIEGQVKQLDPKINFQALAGPVVLRSIVERARRGTTSP